MRIAYFDGTGWSELDRVLDAGSGWNLSSTTVWFESQAPITSTTSATYAAEGEYWLYLGQPTATSPPADLSDVFLFADDFETANLSKWTQPVAAGGFSASSARAHRGTYSVRLDTITNSLRLLRATGVAAAGVSVSAYWYQTSPYSSDSVGFAVRDTTTDGSTITNHGSGFLNSGGVGWNLSHFLNSTYTQDANSSGQTVTADTWVRMTLEMQPGTGTQSPDAIRVLKNGAALNPAAGFLSVTPVSSSGSIALSTYNVPSGSPVYVDDVTARALVIPEPTVALGGIERV